MGYIYDDSHEYTGSIVEFNNDHGTANITSLTVPFSPIQSLNGYDHPWPAGGGKNKLSLLSVTLGGDEPRTKRIAIDPIPAGTYMFSGFNSGTANSGFGFQFYDEVSAGQMVGNSTPGSALTLSAAARSVYVYMSSTDYSNGKTVILNELQIESGSSATSYAPYSNICPISGRTGLSAYVSPTQDQQDATTYAADWTSEAGTVYGGTDEVVAGSLESTYGMVDLGTLNWVKQAAGHFMYTTGLSSLIKHPSSNAEVAKVLCSAAQTASASDVDSESGALIGVVTNGNVRFRYDGFSSDPSQFKQDVAGIQLVYELATPITYQLTPQEVETLVGENNIWSDTEEDITVTVSDIMYGFRGWLLKVGSGMTLVPTSLIQAETYKVTPDQRMEQSAERDVSGYLWRDTVANQPPKIEFETPACYNTDVRKLTDLFIASYTNRAERKLPVAYYDPEEDVYKSTDCYIPNIDFPIRTIDIEANTIMYDPIRFAFIGY